MLHDALLKQRKALGERHPVVATTLNSLSHVLWHERRYDEAASVLREAVDIARAAFGTDHQIVAIYTINLGAVELEREQPAAAEALLREGLRVRAQAPGLVPSRRRTFLEDDWSLGDTKSLLGAALTALRRFDEAEVLLLDARKDLEALHTSRTVDMKPTLSRLVDLYIAWGKPDRASAYRTLAGS
jgi:tetratricopeptide (TPR) repeat protein